MQITMWRIVLMAGDGNKQDDDDNDGCSVSPL